MLITSETATMTDWKYLKLQPQETTNTTNNIDLLRTNEFKQF